MSGYRHGERDGGKEARKKGEMEQGKLSGNEKKLEKGRWAERDG